MVFHYLIFLESVDFSGEPDQTSSLRVSVARSQLTAEVEAVLILNKFIGKKWVLPSDPSSAERSPALQFDHFWRQIQIWRGARGQPPFITSRELLMRPYNFLTSKCWRWPAVRSCWSGRRSPSCWLGPRTTGRPTWAGTSRRSTPASDARGRWTTQLDDAFFKGLKVKIRALIKVVLQPICAVIKRQNLINTISTVCSHIWEEWLQRDLVLMRFNWAFELLATPAHCSQGVYGSFCLHNFIFPPSGVEMCEIRFRRIWRVRIFIRSLSQIRPLFDFRRLLFGLVRDDKIGKKIPHWKGRWQSQNWGLN